MEQSKQIEVSTPVTIPAVPDVSSQKQNRFISDATLGTILCILSDTIFSFSYFFVRILGFGEYKELIHRDWTFCFKETITVAGALPIFLYLLKRKKTTIPPMRIILLLLLAAFFCEFVGVRSHLLSFQEIGIMLGNPLIRTFTIIGTAIIGAFFLKEKLTKLKLGTMLLLFIAIFTLAFSQPTQSTGNIFSFTPSFMLGFGMALITGLGYAIYTILLRYVLRKAKDTTRTGEKKNEPVSVFFIVSVVCGFGAIVGAIFLLKDRGLEGFIKAPTNSGIACIPLKCWIYVGLAGGLNVICFCLKNLSLRYATASKVAVFSVLQIFLATIFGIFYFHEPTTIMVYVGLALIVLGIVLASKTN